MQSCNNYYTATIDVSIAKQLMVCVSIAKQFVVYASIGKTIEKQINCYRKNCSIVNKQTTARASIALRQQKPPTTHMSLTCYSQSIVNQQ